MSHFWGSSEAIPTWVRQRVTGSIVNVSSVHGRSAFNMWAAYDVAKAGIDALTRYIAVEYGPVGIRANAVAPGAIRTSLVQRVIRDSPDPRGRRTRNVDPAPARAHRRARGSRRRRLLAAFGRSLFRHRPIACGRRRLDLALLSLRARRATPRPVRERQDLKRRFDRRRRGRATLKDIARAVGVDVSTVSKVLNDGGISVRAADAPGHHRRSERASTIARMRLPAICARSAPARSAFCCRISPIRSMRQPSAARCVGRDRRAMSCWSLKLPTSARPPPLSEAWSASAASTA